jgi:hypothetical protein
VIHSEGEYDDEYYGSELYFEYFKSMLMSPMEVNFALKRPKCEMSEAADECFKAFRAVTKKIESMDLIQ